MRKAIVEYKMIEEGYKIAICLSSGKDSITMLHAFKTLQKSYLQNFYGKFLFFLFKIDIINIK